jgi:NAD+ synthase
MQQMELGKKATNFSGREATVFEIYKRLHLANQHKMQPIPVCLLPKELK